MRLFPPGPGSGLPPRLSSCRLWSASREILREGGTRMAEYDVIVVGAGNAALAAAVSAREQGARRVVALEKAPAELCGGNTHYSGGLFRFAFDRAEDLRPLVPDAERHIPGS